MLQLEEEERNTLLPLRQVKTAAAAAAVTHARMHAPQANGLSACGQRRCTHTSSSCSAAVSPKKSHIKIPSMSWLNSIFRSNEQFNLWLPPLEICYYPKLMVISRNFLRYSCYVHTSIRAYRLIQWTSLWKSIRSFGAQFSSLAFFNLKKNFIQGTADSPKLGSLLSSFLDPHETFNFFICLQV